MYLLREIDIQQVAVNIVIQWQRMGETVRKLTSAPPCLMCYLCLRTALTNLNMHCRLRALSPSPSPENGRGEPETMAATQFLFYL
jgi:hypothetical protein